MRYLAHDTINGDYEEFETIEEARKYLEEIFLDKEEGYHPDLDGCKIYELKEKVTLKVIADRDNFTEEEWEEEGYNEGFNTICEHKFEAI